MLIILRRCYAAFQSQEGNKFKMPSQKELRGLDCDTPPTKLQLYINQMEWSFKSEIIRIYLLSINVEHKYWTYNFIA